MNDLPTPSPEGQLIRRARELAIPKLTIRAAAARIGMSAEQWGYVERGYLPSRGGRPPQPFRAPAPTVAKMATVVGVTAARMESDGGRPDAAGIIGEILGRESAVHAEPASAPEPRYGNRTLDYLWHTPGLTEAQCEVLIGLARTWVEPSAEAYEERRRA